MNFILRVARGTLHCTCMCCVGMVYAPYLRSTCKYSSLFLVKKIFLVMNKKNNCLLKFANSLLTY